MGRELQKKKRKSGLHKVKRNPKKTQKPLLANQLIAAHWDKSQTLSQNYTRLGLASKLNNPTGGTERQHITALSDEDLRRTNHDRLAINSARPKQFDVKEARIERDPKTGAILRVVDGQGRAPAVQGPYKALNDPLEELDAIVAAAPGEGYGGNGGTVEDESIVENLEAQAARPSAPKKRKQSDRERAFILKLVEKHGTDEAEGCYEKMARDRELNVMQQSAGDLRKRVIKFLRTRSGSQED